MANSLTGFVDFNFDCPNCGNSPLYMANDIDTDEENTVSDVCRYCGKRVTITYKLLVSNIVISEEG